VKLEALNTHNISAITTYARQLLPSNNEVIHEIVSRSQGNWAYMHFICEEIRNGCRDLGKLDGLPHGLWQYYARFWQDWRLTHSVEWIDRHLPILCTLSAAPEALTCQIIADLTNISESEIRALLTTAWRPFITIHANSQGDCFQLYHQSLGDFVSGRVPEGQLLSGECAFAEELRISTKARHAAIAELFLNRWGGFELKAMTFERAFNSTDAYGFRNLVYHLVNSDDKPGLLQLLCAETPLISALRCQPDLSRLRRCLRPRSRELNTQDGDAKRNIWFEKHAYLGDLSKFLDDWNIAQSRIGEMKIDERSVALQFGSLLVQANVRDAAAQLSGGLVIALVTAGLWRLDTAVAYALRIADTNTRANLLIELSTKQDVAQPQVQQDLLRAVNSFDDPERQMICLIELAARWPQSSRDVVINPALGVLSRLKASKFITLGPRLLPYLTISERLEYLAMFQRFDHQSQLRIFALSVDEIQDDSIFAAAIEAAVNEVVKYYETSQNGPGGLLMMSIIASIYPDDRSWAQQTFEGLSSCIARNSLEFDEPPIVDELYEALAILITNFPEMIPPEFISHLVESLLKISHPLDKKTEQLLPFMSGFVTTEMARSQYVARLIAVAPRSVLRSIEKRVFRTKVRHGDWDAYRMLSRRYAQLGEAKHALRIIGRITSRQERSLALADIADYLDIASTKKALSIIEREQKREARSMMYADARESAFHEAYVMSEALVALLPRLAELGDVEEAISRARVLRFGKTDLWKQATSRIAKYAPKDILNVLLTESMQFNDTYHYAIATMCHIASFLGPVELLSLPHMLRFVGYSRNTSERLGWLRVQQGQSRMMHFELRQGATQAIMVKLVELGRQTEAMRVLQEFATDIAESLDAFDVVDGLAELARNATIETARFTLAVASMHDGAYRARALETLMPYLKVDLIPRALEIALSSPFIGHQAWGAASLLGYVAEPERTKVAQEIMNSASDTFNECPQTLGFLAIYVDDAYRELLQLVNKGNQAGFDCVKRFLNTAPPSRTDEIVELAIKTYSPLKLLELGGRMPGNLFRNSLTHVLENELAGLLRSDIALANASLYLAENGEPIRGFELALKISGLSISARVTRRMFELLRQVKRDDLLHFWHSEAWVAGSLSRSGALKLIGALVPLICALEGQQVVRAIFNMVRQVSQWWETSPVALRSMAENDRDARNVAAW
jgi:hypothetical protein